MINSDLNILWSAFFAYWAVLFFLILVSKNKKKSAIMNLSIHAVYSLILVYILSISHGYDAMGMFFALLLP
jgi:hypothetical protein